MLRCGVAVLLWVQIVLSVGCNAQGKDQDYLLRVNNKVVTVFEFKQALEGAIEEVVPGGQEIDSDALTDLRIRVLDQLAEELIITARAEELGVRVSETELEQAILEIKADFPDNTFDETLVENAVSLNSWEKKLATRLLIEKVISQELIDQVHITSADLTTYYHTHYPQGVPESEKGETLNQRTVLHLRRQKAEQRYQQWIDALRQAYTVDVNYRRWEHLYGARS